jgi:cytochrome c oxidase assembly protein subunit 15
MTTSQHHRALVVSAVWTLLLIFLGSVVHATGSSLACPDWPTCFGTMVPAMVGGIFWEHLHRLVAGGLILMWLLTGWLVRQESGPAWVRRGWVTGLVLLLVQAVFGGVTVLLRLPPSISTAHLALAFLFLGLAVALAVETSPHRTDATAHPSLRSTLHRWGTAASGFVLAQSVLGGLMRHLDAGMACPDLPLCFGQLVPPLEQPLVALNFFHRVTALVTGIVVIATALTVLRSTARGQLRRLAWSAISVLFLQIALGVASVATNLAVAPVSLHTLGAASLFAATVALAAWGRPIAEPAPAAVA